MNILKSKAISFLISIFIFAIITLIYTILVYNETIKSDQNSIFRFSLILGGISFFIFGFASGLIEKKNGIISNFISAIILLTIIIVVNILTKQNILPTDWIKYIIYLISCCLGGLVGVNFIFKNKKKTR